MKIVNDPIRKGKFVNSYEVYGSVFHVAQTTEEIAAKIMSSDTGQFLKKGKKFISVTGKVYLQYPLGVTVELDVKKIKTIGSLLWHIAMAYKKIYEEEEKTTKIKVIPIDERGVCSNRNKTDGIYGIWGHDLIDLQFEKITLYNEGYTFINPNKREKRNFTKSGEPYIITVGIGS